MLPDPPADLSGEPETLDHLVGDWRIYQLRKGHRFSTDDLACAWEAVRVRPLARRYLDLGSGVGSVGLSTFAHLPDSARMVTVEAQAVSVGLARRSMVLNGLSERVDVRLGDLRDPTVLPEGPSFDLVTGSPPYIPLGTGHVSPHHQRAHCRMELRGSVADYCAAARRTLAPGGRFVLVHLARDPRPFRAIEEAGLVLCGTRDVFFRWDRDPMLRVFVCGLEPAEAVRLEPWTVRGEDGRWTAAWEAMRRYLARLP